MQSTPAIGRKTKLVCFDLNPTTLKRRKDQLERAGYFVQETCSMDEIKKGTILEGSKGILLDCHFYDHETALLGAVIKKLNPDLPFIIVHAYEPPAWLRSFADLCCNESLAPVSQQLELFFQRRAAAKAGS